MKTFRYWTLTALLSLSALAFSQSPNDSLLYWKLTQSDSDTLIYRELEEIIVHPRPMYKINFRQYSRLVAKIRKVYPFAVEAAEELKIYNVKFQDINDEKQRRKYIRNVEKELFARHEKDFKKFTISEGRYLMLLIDRETGETSFELIRELKGSLPALFWQGFAKIFGNDLKEEYDPVYKHFMIEQIVLMIKDENRGKR
ncbi:MAG TPA: DUF4294 domain-containing protein [Prolixibacteraceae bacterium]|nr:DUF4294 domain-containing protein [Prolixibacteraceae bacterium]